MYEIDHPYYFYLLALVPLVLLFFVMHKLWQKRMRRQFGDAELLEKMAPERSKSKPLVKALLWCLALVFLSIGLVNPRVGSRLENVKREGIDIVFAIDVSKSMLVEDVQPNRLEKAKLVISRSLDELISDRVGMIAYAGKAYPQLPITTDYSAARLFLKTTNTDLIPSQGTAIADAIDMAIEYFDDADQKNRMLVILTDGEDHESGYAEAAQKASARGIKIMAIGIGTAQGAPIPDIVNGRNQGYKRDRNNEVVISKLNTQVLKSIAQQTEGKYVTGSSVSTTVEGLMEEIKQMEKLEFESQIFADYEDQFQWFLGIALLLLIVDVFVLERKTQWFKKLGLFNTEQDEN
jgi:Ca-activated chloride channel family protein